MTTVLKAACHCGKNTFNIKLTTASLPIVNDLCHCSSCRHSTGQLTVNYIRFDGVPLTPTSADSDQPADLSNLTAYNATGVATRWFCSTCSAHLFFEVIGDKYWCVAVGSLEKAEGIVKNEYHIYVADTIDGGIADQIRTVDGFELPRYIGPLEEGKVVPLGWRNDGVINAKRDLETLAFHCRCKAISFTVTRPSAASALPYSAYPDLLLPAHSTDASKVKNPDDEKWWLRPLGAEKPTKYLAGHCACTHCRLTSGFEIQSWAFIPRANVLVSSESGASPTILNLKDEGQRPKGLVQYKGSPGIREFCGTCGATAFWWSEEKQDLLDVSVGLVDETQNGLRAEGWLEWHKERIGQQEEAVNKALVSAVAEGLKALV
ncbi:hypothetical protein Hypma_002321 [Hypsizygus marmoreus]|uniref:CENP-V/GFA domain-containing protein n=1 Tax=Hypsizygus marmoreus TaxID=39966 RepID=A0A369K4Y7_HYPMA|nr:hypothetical protein Hypma_002321 [Hypsizygus marmoreus]